MVSPNVNKILQAAQSLNETERDELFHLLNKRAARQVELTKQQQFRQAMVDQGLLENQPPRGKDLERYSRWQPITIKDKPLSETIIEERR